MPELTLPDLQDAAAVIYLVAQHAGGIPQLAQHTPDNAHRLIAASAKTWREASVMAERYSGAESINHVLYDALERVATIVITRLLKDHQATVTPTRCAVCTAETTELSRYCDHASQCATKPDDLCHDCWHCWAGPCTRCGAHTTIAHAHTDTHQWCDNCEDHIPLNQRQEVYWPFA